MLSNGITRYRDIDRRRADGRGELRGCTALGSGRSLQQAQPDRSAALRPQARPSTGRDLLAGARMLAGVFSNRVFLIKVRTFFFLKDMMLSHAYRTTVQCKQLLYALENQRNSCDSLYCDIDFTVQIRTKPTASLKRACTG